jgi:hypothetical protein
MPRLRAAHTGSTPPSTATEESAMSTPTRTRAAIALAIAGVTASLLTGCNPVDAVQQGVEEAIEGATGGDVSLGELPEGFPESVPLIEGDIGVGAGGAAGGEEGWVVTVTSDAADPMADAVAALEGAGFTKDPSIATGGAGAAFYSDGEYSVLLVGQGKNVSYTVTPTQQ